MSVNDPISDMLTRIRNAGMAQKDETIMPSTRILVAIAAILKQEGYVADYQVIEKRPQNQLVIKLNYGPDRKHVIREIKRVSKPGLRVYAGKDQLPRVRSGLGIAIVSTPQGVLTGYEARKRGIGGDPQPLSGEELRFIADAGVGLRANHRIGTTSFMTRFDFPFYLSKPEYARNDFARDDQFDFRWLISLQAAF